ncbi:MAG: large-conductance mechanosensitive channel protein MscL [Bacteroidota bacterium]
MIKEFKEFIMRGNVLELAVAVIVAGAFGAIVTSFTNDIILPPLGMLLGGVNFSDLAMELQPAVMSETGEVAKEAVLLKYGAFIQTIIDFLIIAFAIFMVLKAYNASQKKAEEAPAAPPAPSNEEVLLGEIRDLLSRR